VDILDSNFLNLKVNFETQKVKNLLYFFYVNTSTNELTIEIYISFENCKISVKNKPGSLNSFLNITQNDDFEFVNFKNCKIDEFLNFIANSDCPSFLKIVKLNPGNAIYLIKDYSNFNTDFFKYIREIILANKENAIFNAYEKNQVI
jgi:hypothetical protein